MGRREYFLSLFLQKFTLSIYFLLFNLVMAVSILISFNLFVTLSFWLIISFYLSPITWDPCILFLYLSLQNLPRSLQF